MSWLGLRHKGTEVLYSWEWNRVVDGLDILYCYVQELERETLKKEELLHLDSDIIPDQDNLRDLGDPSRSWRDIYAHYGYFLDELYVQGRRVLKDLDPVMVYMFIDQARVDIDNIYSVLLDTKSEVRDLETRVSGIEVTLGNVYGVLLNIRTEVSAIESKLDSLMIYVEQVYSYVRKPLDLETQRLIVGATPIPLSDVDMTVKRIHIKVPSWALYLVYIGSATRQDFVLEPGDKEVLEIENPRRVYVRSLGSAEIFIAFEV